MKKYILISTIFLFCSSCADFFESVVDIDPPPHTDQLVVHSFATNTDSTITVFVGKSYPALEDSGDVSVEDATIKILKNDQPWFEGTSTSSTSTNFTLPEPLLLGNNYTMEVDHPDFDKSVSIPQVVPSTTEIVDVEYEQNAIIDADGVDLHAVRFTIKDDPSVENFYEILLFSPSSSSNRDFEVESLDPNGEEGANKTLLLNDDNFNGNDYPVIAYNDQFRSDFMLKVIHLTEDQYLYSLSVQRFEGSKDGGFSIFAEPVSLYTNFDNGLGVFAVSNIQYSEMEYK